MDPTLEKIAMTIVKKTLICSAQVNKHNLQWGKVQVKLRKHLRLIYLIVSALLHHFYFRTYLKTDKC